MRTSSALALHAAIVALSCATFPATPPSPAAPASGRAELLALVERVRRADYQGDRAALARLHGALASTPAGAGDLSRLRYWQAFALWRRAINGFNEKPWPADLDADLRTALAEMEESSQADPAFADAKVGTISCLQLLAYLHGKDRDQVQALVQRFVPLMKETQALAPDNPRLLWVLGASQWWTPPGATPEVVRAHQMRGFETYVRGLEAARARRPAPADTLDPTWGEPELLMNLAWSYLNRQEPDLAQAESHARQALGLVPDWHYVRDILVPQIEAARARAER